MAKNMRGFEDFDSDFDFGFTSVDSASIVSSEEHTHQVVQQTERVDKIKAMITPLLKNLMNQDGDYIHWPNRKQKIQEFMDKLNKV
jgi:diketogulonate reductase-like aldo/keto reductase